MPGAFRQTNLDGGGWVTGFASHPSGRLYLRTDVGGIYRSDDQGQNWTWLSGNFTTYASWLVQGLAVGETSPNLVFQAVGASYTPTDPGRGIWRTTDGGQTWQHVLSGVNFSGNDEFRWQGECIAITPASGDQEIFAITRAQGLWRSTTGGGPGSWSQEGGSLFNGLIGHVVHMHPAFPNEIFVAGVKASASSALFKGIRGPGGNITWTPVTVSPSTTSVTRLARLSSGEIFAAVQEGIHNRFFKSDPAGLNWTDITTTVLGSLTPNGPLGTCQVLSDGNTILLGWLGQPTRKSTDGGATWSSVPMVITGNRPIAMLTTEAKIGWARGCVHQDPLNPNRWYLPGGYGPFLSTDAGATASYMTQGIGEVVTWKPVWHPNDPQRVYLPVADLICFITTDGSSTGLAQRNPRRHLPVINGNVGMTYATKALLGPVTGSNPPKVYFIGGSYFGPNSGRASILTTQDDGLSWSLVHVSGLLGTGLPDFCEIVSGSIAPDNENEIIVAVNASSASQSGFYRSTDGGISFTICTGIPTGGSWGGQFSNFVSMESNSLNPNQRFAWINGIGFLVSNDRGVTWAPQGHSPAGPSESKLYNWNVWGYLTRDPVTGQLWFGGMAGHLGLAYSTNNGTNWTYLDSPFSSTGFAEVRALDAYNGQILVFGRRFEDSFLKIYLSQDNGSTFRECTKPEYRFPRTTYVALNPHQPGHFWVSTNGRSYARFFPGEFHAWTQTHFTDPELNTPSISSPTADPDGDGQTNEFEFITGLLPKDNQSRFIQEILSFGGAPPTISLKIHPRHPDRNYTVEYTHDLLYPNSWQPLTNFQIQDNGLTRIFTDLDPTTPRKFYRVKISRP